MHTERIRALIEEGKSAERQTGMLRRALTHLATVDRRGLKEAEMQKVINFVSDYVEHALALMMLIENAAANIDRLQEVQPVLDAAENYFLAADDTIPDHFGLIGLMDDAYLIHRLLQALSDDYKSQSGESLLPLETHEDNAFIRRLIGEPFASILDDQVSATLAGPGLQDNLNQMLTLLGQTNLSSSPDPIWGTAGATGTSDARLAAIDIFKS